MQFFPKRKGFSKLFSRAEFEKFWNNAKEENNLEGIDLNGIPSPYDTEGSDKGDPLDEEMTKIDYLLRTVPQLDVVGYMFRTGPAERTEESV